MPGFEKVERERSKKNDEVITLSLENLEADLEKHFNDVDLENIKFEEKKLEQSPVSKENLLLAQYPEIRKLIEETSDIDIDLERDDAADQLQSKSNIEKQTQRVQLHREKIRDRNVKNFTESMRIIAKRDMLDPDYTEEVIQSTINELMDENNPLAGMLEDPRVILDKIVPDAIEKIQAMEEMDAMTH